MLELGNLLEPVVGEHGGGRLPEVFARPAPDQSLPDTLALGGAHRAFDLEVGRRDDLLQRLETGEDADAAEPAVLAKLLNRRLLDALADGDADDEQERTSDHSAEREERSDLVLPQGRQSEAEQVAGTHSFQV